MQRSSRASLANGSWVLAGSYYSSPHTNLLFPCKCLNLALAGRLGASNCSKVWEQGYTRRFGRTRTNAQHGTAKECPSTA